MSWNKTNLAVIIFILGIIAAGAFHMCERADDAFLSTFCFCANLTVYFTLLLFWIQSVRHRILPSRGRSYMIWAAGLMLFFLFVRTIRYRISGNETIIQRYTWYIYYIPLALIPALFLLTCFFIDKKASRIDERLLLIPAAVLALFVLTNDLHYLFFKPVEGEPFDGESGRYATNFMYYIFYAVIVGYFITGIVFVVRALKQNAQKIIMPFLFLGLWGALIALMSVFSALDIRTPYYMPEITIFVMLGVFESCIRGRLFAYNENYEGFFESMNEPALICDNSLSPVYCTSTAVEADSTQLKKSINNSFNIDGDTILKGRKLKSG